MTQNVMIVCGEASGDLHGANLVRALLTKDPDLNFCGMGGPELQSLGIDILYDAQKVAVVGVFEVFAHLKDIFAAQKILRKTLQRKRPDLLILIDLPDFNLILAKFAKKIGIPVFYYICPQVWAWRTSRVYTIKKRVDKLGVILPFEEEFFQSYGVKASYVGHPLLDSVKTTFSKKHFRENHNINYGSKCIGLLPGSRKREVLSLLPIFLEAAEKLQDNTNDELIFLIPKASTISMEEFTQAGVDKYRESLNLRIIEGERYDVMANCDCVVAASGTVTLELAILKIPMVVTYKLAPLTHFLGQFLIKLEFFSLVNLIAGHKVVPELLQKEVSANRICYELSLLLNAHGKRKKMNLGLNLVKNALGKPGASKRAATVVMELLNQKK